MEPGLIEDANFSPPWYDLMVKMATIGPLFRCFPWLNKSVDFCFPRLVRFTVFRIFFPLCFPICIYLAHKAYINLHHQAFATLTGIGDGEHVSQGWFKYDARQYRPFIHRKNQERIGIFGKDRWDSTMDLGFPPSAFERYHTGIGKVIRPPPGRIHDILVGRHVSWGAYPILCCLLRSFESVDRKATTSWVRGCLSFVSYWRWETNAYLGRVGETAILTRLHQRSVKVS